MFFLFHVVPSDDRAIADGMSASAGGESGWHALQQGDVAPAIVLDTTPEDEARRRQPVEVWLHNDDYTPAEYVVAVLEKAFALGWWKANWIMVRAHATGRAIVGRYPRGEAESRVASAERRARADGWPLRLTVEDPEP